jgi:hypothetical protein
MEKQQQTSQKDNPPPLDGGSSSGCIQPCRLDTKSRARMSEPTEKAAEGKQIRSYHRRHRDIFP